MDHPRRCTILLTAAFALGGALCAAHADEPVRIEVYPAAVRLDSPESRMHLVVSGHFADGRVQDLSREAEFTSSDAAVARVERGEVAPAGNGRAEIAVRAGGQSATASVEVTNFEQHKPVSFQYGVLAVLSRQGCNSGACHGSPSGKGGFRLSLRAYDAVFDAEMLVRESFGRRNNQFNPAESLLLRKPLMELSHGGGRRLKKSDPSYRLLRDWIAEGCHEDAADAAQCVRLEVFPKQRVIVAPAHQQQVLALAHFSDGSVRDVTRLVMFSSSDETVATVNSSGMVVASDRGETAILVRYLEKVETASLTFLRPVEGFVWPAVPENNYIDGHVFAKLKQLQIPPSELCTDEEFLRRAYLDAIGLLPTPDEASTFLADTDPKKREKLVDALLARPEMAPFWALKWGDLLRIRSTKVSGAGVHKFYRWLYAAMRDNMPYDRFARELLTASGSTFANPPANYYRTAAETNDCTETTSQVFLGVRIQCAKCHNHPFERWTQDNYYGIAALFNRVERKPGSTPDEQVIWAKRGGEVTQPRTGKVMPPWLPHSGELALAPDQDRREALADWLVRPDNPFFARVEVNRIWSHFIGRGIVEPVDDFRDSNPPANADLLSALADDFVKGGFDRRRVMRAILTSRTYQLSSRATDLNRRDTRYFSHAWPRLLSAEQLLDAICQVTLVPEKFAGLPDGTRATQLPSPDVENEFLKVFGQPARETACQCERSTDSNLSQALQMINGPLVHGKVRSDKNRLRQLVTTGKNNAEAVRELYLAALCRAPSDAELAAAVAHIDANSDRMIALEDVCWALLNTNEFLFQH